MPFGHAGRILHVDLTKGILTVEEPEDTFYRQYMGGSALGMYYLLRDTPSDVDAFHPANTLVLSLGPLTGTSISGQSRLTATAKSPLTGTAGDTQSGGFFPAQLRFAGFDALVIRGRAPKPVYLWLNDGQAELRPADHLWGKTTGEAQSAIHQELGDPKIEVLQCGPAGENLVRFAALVSMCNRANGRTGMGAVMGSKNLRAVAVRGTSRPSVADPTALDQLKRWGAKEFPESDVHSLNLLGTAGSIRYQHKSGGLPTHNWSSGAFELWQPIDGRTLRDTVLLRRDTCYACVVRCKPVVEVKQGRYQVDAIYGGPEYESLAALGSYCGVDDLEAVCYANQLCNAYGMDTVSCGAGIAWAMDCYQQGIITQEDTGGLALEFGSAEAMVAMTEMIARREGFGDLLAEGSARAAAILGRGSGDLLTTVKSQEMPAHMPQLKRSLALIYAVNPFGADHMSHEHDPSYEGYPERMAEIGLTDPQPNTALNQEKVHYALTTQFVYSCLDSVNVCQFVFGPAWQLYSTGQLAEAIRAVTGWDVTVEELLRLGERRLNMMRAFNAIQGLSRDADTLPKKLSLPLTGGKSGGMFVTPGEVEQAKDWYYAMAGWDTATGVPTRQKLQELSLGWVAELLEDHEGS